MTDFCNHGAQPLCRHCRRGRASAGRRGLCRRCHDTPDVRARYAADGDGEGHRGDLAGRRQADLWALLPTDALPGTAEKVGVMESRAALGLPLFWPGDARDEPADAPADLGGCGAIEALFLPEREPRRARAATA